MKLDDRDIAALADIAAFPAILEVVCRTTGMGFAAIAHVTADRWITCQALDHIGFGLKPGDELEVETTLCHEIRQSREPVVIEDVRQDQAYCDHPTPRRYDFQSYISVPIMLPDATFFGTLCAIDPNPARLSPNTLGMFTLFAELIAFHLDGHMRLLESQANLTTERETARLREEFIAVLGHDLRNPLASIKAGTGTLLRHSQEERTLKIAQLMQRSVIRMEDLIVNVLDFARGRLGGGLSLSRELTSLDEPLNQVLEELQSSAPERTFEVELDLGLPVDCDAGKIAQLLSNLIGNAISHGSEGEPIRVLAHTSDKVLELSVANAGPPIPVAVQGHLFQPFYRGYKRSSLQGLGLGLYISAQIARAHGGRLSVQSDEKLTVFSFTMPRIGSQFAAG